MTGWNRRRQIIIAVGAFCLLILFAYWIYYSDNKITQSRSSEKAGQNLEKPIVLYRGITLDDADRQVEIVTSKNEAEKNKIVKKYSKEYYLYSNQEFLGKENGTVCVRGSNDYWEVNFQNPHNFEVAISQPYNPYPRKVTFNYSASEFKYSNTVTSEINNKYRVNCQIEGLFSVDLDGDGNEEHLITLFDRKKYFIATCLVYSKPKKTSCLMIYEESIIVRDLLLEDYDSLVSNEIIDVDNDGIMEILIQMPNGGVDFEVYKYRNGKFDGDYTAKATLKQQNLMV